MLKQLAAAVLLPLPFAAVPLLAVLAGMPGEDNPDLVLREAPPTMTAVTDSPASAGRGSAEMTYGIADDAGCREEPGSAS